MAGAAVAALVAGGLSAAAAEAQQPGRVLRMATSVDAATLDPHATNALFTFLVVHQVYEGLTWRGDDLKVHPGLATRWEQVEPNRWRFSLREGVRFAGGESFEADDVVFSIQRALAPTSNYGIFVDTVERVEARDRLTVDIVTRVPDPVIPDKMTRVMIMDRGWSEANRATVPQNFARQEETFSVRNANGTGPYVIRAREQEQRTVMVRNPNWWGWQAGGPARGNVTEYHHVTLTSDATRIAALISGEVDFVHVVPVQDVARVGRDARLRVLEGQENRTVWIGMRQDVDELAGSDVRGRNPFKDLRVRQAVAHAMDLDALRRATLRGQGVPTGSMWTEFVNGWSRDTDRRTPFDPARARALLAEAGYPQGFSVPLDCPTGTYDEACQAVAGMLARVGIRAQLTIHPNAVFTQRVRRQESTMYMLSWGVPTFDASYTLRAIMASRSIGGAATWNAGGYSNADFDALLPRIDAEQDPERRRALIREAHAMHNADLGHVPLYHMMIPWAVRAGVTVTHRADNQFQVREIRVD
ncbi:ABC transporter substrate-binding protein [Falsiroseomonas sp. HW251]|uniref:ABC transporter substrate-binding protein n=1 Tax=Falsiroseomonas sp. HW251 TaxID=3390998 RepID=UPI003D3200C9